MNPVRIIRRYFTWKNTESEFKAFIDAWKINDNRTRELSGSVAVVVQPWLMTAAPWFFTAIALFFTRLNKKVTIILDDVEFGSGKFRFNVQMRSIRRMMACLPQQVEIIELKNCRRKKPIVPINSPSFLDQLATLNTIHRMKGEISEDQRETNFEIIRKHLEVANESINILFQEKSFDFILLGGGIWGSSGLYMKHAELNGIRAATIDAGFGSILANTRGIAAYQSDIPVAFSQVEERYTDKIIDIAEKEMKNRKLGVDKYQTQSTVYGGSAGNAPDKDVGILILLNISWDSAALGLHQAFDDTPEWIGETIQWILENSDETITVRQHPHERTAFGKSNDDYKKLIARKFDENDRIRFVSAADEVNTYNLIEDSLCVITFSTTTSMEAVAMGKVVINVSRCYYADLGFVYNAKTREEYFGYLKDAIAGKLAVSERQKKDALKCYYLSQCCNRIDTMFTPQPADFERWVKRDPGEICQMKEVRLLLYALDHGVPASLLRHQEIMESQTL